MSDTGHWHDSRRYWSIRLILFICFIMAFDISMIIVQLFRNPSLDMMILIAVLMSIPFLMVLYFLTSEIKTGNIMKFRHIDLPDFHIKGPRDKAGIPDAAKITTTMDRLLDSHRVEYTTTDFNALFEYPVEWHYSLKDPAISIVIEKRLIQNNTEFTFSIGPCKGPNGKLCDALMSSIDDKFKQVST